MWGHVTEEEEDGRLRRTHHVLGGRHELDGAQRELGTFQAVAAQPVRVELAEVFVGDCGGGGVEVSGGGGGGGGDGGGGDEVAVMEVAAASHRR